MLDLSVKKSMFMNLRKWNRINFTVSKDSIPSKNLTISNISL